MLYTGKRKFLSGEKIDPLRTPYSSAFWRVVKKENKKEVAYTCPQTLFLLYFPVSATTKIYKTHQLQ
ncbi:hypothetical protein PORCRE_785 [Porphyromonas crevioricanis JCM 15906]|uniref:Uncharacterized protein n=1 Tax=Porphyromonas crevioricanis JCM 15906 TaxID=1305617 RepID=T1CMT6_9PORP|nr:hypothetical protein PORCRE_785 [Porphyromonas crevioricanis JCM 15906]